MVRSVVALLCFLLVGSFARAGPNAGGALNVHDASLLMSATTGAVSVCVQGVVPPDCSQLDTEIDGAGGLPVGDAAIFKVYAAFHNTPRLMGVTWGIVYDGNNIILPYFGMCGDFELNDTGWPNSGTGSTVTWNSLQQSLLVPVYWFAAYTYGAPGQLTLGPNPTQGGYFGDDSVPAVLDVIAGFGAMGFDVPGLLVCLVIPPVGVCCDPATGSCTLISEEDCLPPNVFYPEFQSCDPNPCIVPPEPGVCCNPVTGECVMVFPQECLPPWVFFPEFQNCDPNPCGIEPPPIPVERQSWGRVKAAYR